MSITIVKVVRRKLYIVHYKVKHKLTKLILNPETKKTIWMIYEIRLLKEVFYKPAILWRYGLPVPDLVREQEACL